MKKPLKTAAICGIIMLAASLIVGIIALVVTALAYTSPATSGASSVIMPEQFRPAQLVVTILSLLLIPLGVAFLYGFVVLGKKVDSKIVFDIAWILIVLSVLGGVMVLMSIFTGDIYIKPQANYDPNASLSSIFTNSIKQSVTSSPTYAPLFRVVGDSDAFFWTFLIVMVLGGIALYVIFGIGIIKLKNKEIPLAVATGIFYILAPFWAVFSVVASILTIIMFFKCSRKFEAGRKEEKTEEPVEKTTVKKTRKK